MTNEQAIERCKESIKELIKESHADWIGISNQIEIETILSELERLEQQNKEHQKINGELQEKLTKAEKLIDMAEYLSSIDFFDMCDEIPEPCMGCDASEDIDRHIKCIKQYFKEKVEKV